MKVGEVDWGEVAKGPKRSIHTDIPCSQWGVFQGFPWGEGEWCLPAIYPAKPCAGLVTFHSLHLCHYVHSTDEGK